MDSSKIIRCLLLVVSGVLYSFLSWSQQQTVSGHVSSVAEEPIPGVNITIAGTSEGTVSDIDGNYTIAVPDQQAQLVFSSIGYVTDTVKVGSQSLIDVILAQDITTLQEVIVTGYTTQNKKDITGSVSSVGNDKLVEVPAASFTQQLQGRVTGVVIGQDNAPGGEPLVRIRGWSTINDNDPLYIIDGIPTKSDLQTINPANVESVQILKDASAASIYGARAANGVGVVTTKKGKPGKPKLTLDARTGIQFATNLPEMLNTQELGEFYYQAFRNDYIDFHGSDDGFTFNHGQYGPDPTAPNFIPDYVFPSRSFEGDPAANPDLYSLDPYYGITRANNRGTDWFDEVFEPSTLQEYNLGVTGGSEYGNYFAVFNYFNQEGIINHTGFERFTLRINTEFTPKPWLTFGETLEVSYNQFKGQRFDDITGGIYTAAPISPVYDIGGFYASRRGADMGEAGNPVANLERTKDNHLDSWRIFGGIFLEVDLLPQLTFKSQLGIDYRNQYLEWFSSRRLEVMDNSTNRLIVDQNSNFDWTWYNTLNYNTSFNEVHQVNLLIGTEAIERKYHVLGGQRTSFAFEDLNYRVLDAGTDFIENRGNKSESSLFSLFAKLNYSYRSKYLLDVTIRRDGSSRFSRSQRYATFPAISLGWRLSEEPFFSGIQWTTDLKLRGSWGQMGNQEIADFNQFNTYRSGLAESGYDINGLNVAVQPGFDTERFGNPETIWETTTTFDIGIDWTLWNKLTVNFDWYDMTTTDMLYVLTLPGTMGDAQYPFQNVGEMNNQGIDLGLSWQDNWPNSDLTYSIALNVSHYQNKIVKLSDNAEEGFFGLGGPFGFWTRNVAGVPYSSFYGYIIDGFTDGSEDPMEFEDYYDYGDGKGRFRYRDVDEDGKITDRDRTFIGNPHPDLTYGLSLNAGYRHFDFALFFQGSHGNDLIRFAGGLSDFYTANSNNASKQALYQSWTPELGDNANLPIISARDNVSNRPSTYFVEDGSYLRLKNLQVGYTFGQLKGIDKLRMYFQAVNLFTITDYQGLDPEINVSGKGSNRANLGLDLGYYPSSRQFLVGVNFTL